MIVEWVEEPSSYGPSHRSFRWECPFCAYVRHSFTWMPSPLPDGVSEDDYLPTPESVCWWCDRDATGVVQWRLGREGGSNMEGEWCPTNAWAGTKRILTAQHDPEDRREAFFPSRVFYPHVTLHVRVYGMFARNSRRCRPCSWSAELRMGDISERISPPPEKKVWRARSLAQVQRDVDNLDLTESLRTLLKRFYSIEGARCLWRLEEGTWVPWRTSLVTVNGLHLPSGIYLEAKEGPLWKDQTLVVTVHRVDGYGSSSGGGAYVLPASVEYWLPMTSQEIE